jgi:hypothetical protein
MIGGLSEASTDAAHSHVSAERWVEREIDTGGRYPRITKATKSKVKKPRGPGPGFKIAFAERPGC